METPDEHTLQFTPRLDFYLASGAPGVSDVRPGDAWLEKAAASTAACALTSDCQRNQQWSPHYERLDDLGELGDVIYPKQIAWFTGLGVANVTLGRRHALAWSSRPPPEARVKNFTRTLRHAEARLWTNELRHEMWGDSDLDTHVWVGHRPGGRPGRDGRLGDEETLGYAPPR